MALLIFFRRLLAPFTCAAPPSNRYRAVTTPIFAQQHISTKPVHLINIHNITPLFGAGGLNSLLATTQGLAHTFAQCLEYPGATQGQTVVSMNHHPKKSHHSTPQPRSLLPPPLRELRQRQRRPQRAPLPKTLQPQPLESQHRKRGEGKRL